MRQSLLVLLCVVHISLSGCSPRAANPQIVRTTNRDSAWHAKFLSSRLIALQREKEGIKITGTVFQTPNAETRVVAVGYKITHPDDHGSTSYTVSKITDEGVVFQYESSFSHQSFGKNLITIDQGTFLLQWFDAASK